MIPTGEPDEVVGAARHVEGLAADMAQIGGDLRASVSELMGSWSGAGADAFAEHMSRRIDACTIAGQALAGAALALRQYAGKIAQAQHATEHVRQQAIRTGLRLAGDELDPTSLLPPDPDKAAAAADLERQLAESELEGLWASSALASSLEPQQQLAEKARYLLGDRSGLDPAGFATDVGRGVKQFFWTLGLGAVEPLSAAGMAALGSPKGTDEYKRELQQALEFAREHPDDAVAALLGADQVQQEIDSGHPGEALGIAATTIGMALDPEGGTETAAGRALAREQLVARLPKMEIGTQVNHLPNAERALTDPAKFRDYSMNSGHPKNDGKWKAWDDLGYQIDSADRREAATRDVVEQLGAQLPQTSGILTDQTRYGPRFEVRTNIVGPNGRTGTLVTLWQYDSGSDTPRLITNWLETHT
jgi:uncharacterized protein YukE